MGVVAREGGVVPLHFAARVPGLGQEIQIVDRDHAGGVPGGNRGGRALLFKSFGLSILYLHMKIAVVGTGYVGLVVGACLAENGNTVVCVDKDEQKIATLEAGRMPIYEPGLEELVRRNHHEERLSFTTDLTTALRGSEIVFIAVG